MKIIFCQFNHIAENGIADAFTRLGHEIILFNEVCSNMDLDKNYINALFNFYNTQNEIDFIFSVNYIPIISMTSKVLRLPYLCWIMDSPALPLYSNTLANENNHVFIFDAKLAQKFQVLYPDNVYHLPLGCDPKIFDTLKITDNEYNTYKCDISFAGSLYDNCAYNSIVNQLPAYLHGYFDALINAQINVYGYNFLADSLTEPLVQQFNKYVDWGLLSNYTSDTKQIIADYYIGYKVTEQERIRTLDAISRCFKIDLYSASDCSILPSVNYRGIADSKTMIHKIYNLSKINLNITSKTIQTGLPLRIFEIMSAGGFVISNYQSEIPEYFIPDEDIVLYDSIHDLLEKIEYYLTHEDKRKHIAEQGLRKVMNYYTYDIQLNKMLSLCNLQ